MYNKALLKNILTQEELEYLINYFYYSKNSYVIKNGMKKLPILFNDFQLISFLNKIIEEKLNIKNYKLLGDNFYEHSLSYFPHCDANQTNSWLNIVIPLKLFDLTELEQKFIIFDQQYTSPATWIGSLEIENDFDSNKKNNKRICDTDNVLNLTNDTVPSDLWNEIDTTWLSKDYLFGISGTVFRWSPGDVIVFDSRYIHATGKMHVSKKLGLSVRIGY